MYQSELKIKHKVIIVGSGPAALTAAIYAARADLFPLVAAGETDDRNMPGGQLMLTTEVENFPGFPDGIQGPDLIENMIKQAKKFGALIIERWATEFLIKENEPFKVKVGDVWYDTHSIILANGSSARWLGLPDENKFRNHGLSACATCDGPLPFYRNKHLYVVGGGDSAVEEATFLARFASEVTIIHRRNALRASKAMQKRAQNHPKINFLYNSKVVEYKGDKSLESIVVENVLTGERSELPVGGLFMAIGHEPATKHLKNTSITLDELGNIKTKNHVETNIEGIFAAGDVHDVHYRQAITACGFGCMAAISSERWVTEKLSKLETL
ncbi:thioredoxin reductase-like [Schistocerca gregaria]|uniref:thioredoxin reductase-like n=1 Tax=Schistocerca gregaria TaxID=7010 RepID=UPI00211F1BCD|nr:thioredoxin reductase-like [Schistocerca gregaria]